MKSFIKYLYDYAYTGEQAENNDEESGEDEEIDVKLTGEKNPTNDSNGHVIEIDLLFVFVSIFISDST